MSDTNEIDGRLARARRGERGILAELFALHRSRLRRMVELRMDRRLQGRLDASDVLQEAYLEAARAFPEYLRAGASPFYLWLRCIAGRKLIGLHRHHLGAQARDVRREVSLEQLGAPAATSEALAAQLLGHEPSPSEAAAREERRQRLEEALNHMDAIDREVLVLRHFEQLTSAETAEVLGIKEPAAIQRHVRALKRLKEILRSPS